MDKKTLLAIALTALVIIVTPMIFPSPTPAPPAPADSMAVAAGQPTIAPAPATQAATPQATRLAGSTKRATAPAAASAALRPVETTTVRTARAEYTLTSAGGVPTQVTLPDYRSLRPGIAKGTPVRLIEQNDRLFRLSLRTSTEVIALDTVTFRFGPQRQEGSFAVITATSTSLAKPITLTYRFPADSFAMSVEGTVALTPGTSAQVTAWLPTRIHTDEADVKEDTRLLALAYRVGVSDPKGVSFNSIDTIPQLDSGAVRWFAVRNKYFVVAALSSPTATPFQSLIRRGEPHEDDATVAYVSSVLPITDGRFSFRVFAGPQSWEHLRATAPELENVNPYGGWLHGVVQPFATIVMRLLLWMRDTVNVGYGWVLVIFGVVVRLLMWPLNQNAMRSSMKLQRIQPQLQELQTKYKNDPEKQREAMMRLYSDHGMSPFTPILGCLPMLLPMPILFALYFVFQNTIELRGVSFLWLPDLSLRDPYFITPLFMGASMFVLSWIGMRGMPPNPQSKMMLYIMPVMFTVLFWNFASGLNLYYAVQNVAALPQQWLLARERVTAKSVTAKSAGGAKAPGG
ncbi:MAG: membrane protein insertase YidC [Gemmatimonadota bacterium]